MRKLSDTISRLRALRSQPAGQGHHGVDRLSSLGDFGSNPGALQARTYLPRNLNAGAPLVVVLHGCTQTAAAYDLGSGWSKLADQQGFALLFPEQQRSNNPNLCFNWFVPSDIRRDSGEVLSIRQMIETMVDAHDLDRRRIFVTGLSAGGAMAAAMLATYPEVFAGGAIIAGLPFATASTIPHAFDRMRGHGHRSEAQLQRLLTEASPHTGPWPTISIWQGSSDQTVAASNAKAILGQWRGVHGLAKTPTRSEVVDGQARQVWSDAKGCELVEIYTIEGMGHGTPLSTSGEDGLGSPGPFMLDVGISSTRHIARFWGLSKFAERQPRQETSSRAEIVAWRGGHVEAASNAKTEDALRNPHPEPQDTKSAAPTRAAGVQKIIEDALRAAGLMR